MKRLLLALSCSFAWNCPGLTLAAPASSATSPKSALKSAGLQKSFRKAMEAFEAKHFEEAIDLFQEILRRQPDHNPSRITLARSLYQLKNIPEALKAFEQSDFKEIEPDAAYDFGQVAFKSNSFALATKAFAAVPNGHPLYDLAGYYGGICAYKQGEYQAALDLFDQAVVLPSKLTRSQHVYRKEAEKKLIAKQKRELKEGSVSTTRTSDKNPPASVAQPTQFLLNPDRMVGLSYSYLSQTTETKLGLSEKHNLSRATLSAEFGSQRPPTSVAKSQWIYVARLAAATTKDGEKESPLLVSLRKTLELMTLSLYKPESLFFGEIAGGYESAIGENANFGATTGVYSYVGDSDFAKRILYSPYISIFIAQKGDTIETSITAESHARFDRDKLLFTQTEQRGTIQLNLSPKISIGLNGELNEYSYNTARLSGPDWNGRILLNLGLNPTKAMSFSIGTYYEIAQGWRLYDSFPEAPLVKFNLSQTGAFAQADIAVTTWWALGTRLRFANKTYANSLPEGAQELLDQGYGSKISQIDAYTSFTKTF